MVRRPSPMPLKTWSRNATLRHHLTRISTTMRFALLPAVFLLLFSSNAWAQEAWVQDVSERHYFAVMVEDFDAVAEWYQQVFDMEYVWGLEGDEAGRRTANYLNDFIHVELVHLPDYSRNERPFGLFKVGAYVPDVEVIADRIGRSTGERPRVVEFETMNQKLVQIRDPEGTLIQFMSPLKEK